MFGLFERVAGWWNGLQVGQQMILIFGVMLFMIIGAVAAVAPSEEENRQAFLIRQLNIKQQSTSVALNAGELR